MGSLLRKKHLLIIGLATVAVSGSPATLSGVTPWAVPVALAGESVTVENLVIETGLGPIRIPRLEAEDSSVSAADIQALLTSSDLASAADRIAQISAKHWRIPELVFEQKLGEVTQTVTYRDIVLEEIAGGRIRRMSASGADINATAATGEGMSGRMGTILASGIDLAAALRIMTTTSSDPTAPLTTIYQSFAVDGYEFKLAEQMQMRFGTIAGQNFRMRPLSIPLNELVQKLMAAAPATPGQPPTPEQQAKAFEVLPALIEIYRAYAFDEATGSDFAFSVKTPEGDVNFDMARFSLRNFADARIGELSMEGLAMSKVGADGGKFALGKFTMKGLDFGNLLKVVQELAETQQAIAANPDLADAPIPTPAFQMPRFDEISMDGLEFDAMVPKKSGNPGELEHLKMSLARMALTVGGWTEVMPTSIGYELDRFHMEPDPADQQFAQVRALGIDAIDLSLRTAVDYDAASQRLTLSDISFDMAKVGRFAMKGTVENVPPEALSGDPTAAQLAMMQATVKSLDLEIVDGGAIALALAQQSAASGVPADQLRQQMAAMPVAALPQILGQSPKVSELANALSTFVTSGGTLKIAASSLSGVGMLDMADIPGIMAKTDITATVGP
ncbi:MAG: hypothetical protein R3D57_01490 [Hyphomicrobiaceae bacterium]